MTGKWSITLDSPARFRFHRWLLPECDALEVNAEPDAIHVIARSKLNGDSKNIVLRPNRARAGWDADPGADPGGALLIPRFDTGTREIGIILPDTPEGIENVEHELVVDDTVRRTIWSGYQATFDILRRYAPAYVPWVDRLLRNLAPVHAAPGGYVGGGSMRDNQGTIRLPFKDEPVGLAANLAHECAHQHFFLIRAAGRVDDGSDTSVHHSPFVEANRDLATLVLTYHAFANEALVLRTCELAGIEDPYAGKRAELLRSTLQPVEDTLSKSKALTQLGRDLWEPAAERLHRAFS
jgi:HEXXH motif-containing protein